MSTTMNSRSITDYILKLERENRELQSLCDEQGETIRTLTFTRLISRSKSATSRRNLPRPTKSLATRLSSSRTYSMKLTKRRSVLSSPSTTRPHHPSGRAARTRVSLIVSLNLGR